MIKKVMSVLIALVVALALFAGSASAMMDDNMMVSSGQTVSTPQFSGTGMTGGSGSWYMNGNEYGGYGMMDNNANNWIWNTVAVVLLVLLLLVVLALPALLVLLLLIGVVVLVYLGIFRTIRRPAQV